MTDDFGHWLAGFIDGEGCFTIPSRSNASKGYHGRAFGCRMDLGLRQDDRPILDLIQSTTKLGKVGMVYAKRYTMARWYIGSKEGCRGLVTLLDQYPLRAKKRRDYDVWRLAVKEWTTTRDWGRMAALSDQLVTGR